MEEQPPQLSIDYGRILQDCLQSAVRTILRQVESEGLPGDHHYYVNFLTQHPETRISEALKAEYPEEITIVLQNQFWDLQVGDKGFSVRLGFGARFEIIYVPFDAILGFSDPAAQFGLQFQPNADEQGGEAGDDNNIVAKASPKITPKAPPSQEKMETPPKSAKPKDKVADISRMRKSPATPARAAKAKSKDSGVAENNVVTLDTFRSAKD